MTTVDLVSHSYTYLVTDLRTNKIIGELPLQSVSYSTKLSGAGDFGGSFKINYDTIKFDPNSATQPGRVGLYIVRDGVVVWGGIIWKRQYNGRERQLSLVGQSFESYFYHRLQLTNMYWSHTDQLDMARWLVTSNGSAAALGINVSNATSSRFRERTMWGYEFKTTGLELEQLSNLQDGFDWNVEVGRDSTTGEMTRSLQFYYPAKGAERDTTQLLFEYPGAIYDFTITDDADNSAISLWAIGAGEASDQITANSQDYPQIVTGWPLIELTRSYKSVYYIDTLQGHADADLQLLKTAVSLFEVTINPNLQPQLGTYGVGDWARFKMQDDFLTPGINAYARITEISVTVDGATGIETVTLTLGGNQASADTSNVTDIPDDGGDL